MLVTATILSLVASMQRTLFGQSRATSAFLSAMLQQMVPSASPAGAAAPREGEFRFAAAESVHPVLSRAVAECVQELRARMGTGIQPHMLQLLVDSETHGNFIEMAPQFVLECLTTRGVSTVPVLFGGATTELVGTQHPRPTVSIMAAYLPGVELFPFYAKDASLPSLPQGAWPRLIKAATANQTRPPPSQAAEPAMAAPPAEDDSNSLSTGSLSRAQGVATFLHAEPLSQARFLAQRLRAALPGMPVLGGLVNKKGWGKRSPRGALFHGERTMDHGAVGCLLAGPIQVDQVIVQGWEPPQVKITGDDMTSMQKHRFAALLTTWWFQVADNDDLDRKARESLAVLLQEYATLLKATYEVHPETMAAFSYSSALISHEEEAAILAVHPQLPFQGARCHPFGGFPWEAQEPGEYGSASSATMCAVLRAASPAAAGGGRSFKVEG